VFFGNRDAGPQRKPIVPYPPTSRLPAHPLLRHMRGRSWKPGHMAPTVAVGEGALSSRLAAVRRSPTRAIGPACWFPRISLSPSTGKPEIYGQQDLPWDRNGGASRIETPPLSGFLPNKDRGMGDTLVTIGRAGRGYPFLEDVQRCRLGRAARTSFGLIL